MTTRHRTGASPGKERAKGRERSRQKSCEKGCERRRERSRERSRAWAAALGCILLGGCAGSSGAPEAADGAPPAPSSGAQAASQPDEKTSLTAAFLAHPAYDHFALSPDGTKIAAVASHADEDRIVLFDVEAWRTGRQGEPEQVLVERRTERGWGASRTIDDLGWASDELLVYSLQTPLLSPEDGVERAVGRSQRASSRERLGVGSRARKTRLYVTTLAGRRRHLAKRWPQGEYAQFQTDVIDYLEDDPDHILINFEGRAVRVDTRSGGRLTVEPAPRTADTRWLADHAGVVRAGLSTRGFDRRVELRVRRSARDPWIVVSNFDLYREPGFWFEAFTPDPARILVLSDLDGSRTALHEWSLEHEALGPKLHAEAIGDADVAGTLVSRRDGRLLAVATCAHRCGLVAVDPEFERFWDGVVAAFPGRNLTIVDRTPDERRWLVRVSSDQAAPSIHLVEPGGDRPLEIADLLPGLAGRKLAAMQPVRYAARDGLWVEGYLTRPPDATPPFPLVVVPHDHAESRDYWGFDPVAQHLAARGFAVLQPNYRGSTGYGRAFWLAGQGEWSGGVLRDVIDGARALVRSGIADPARIGLYGEGFGGHLALLALAEEPALFAAGASWGAMTDLALMLADDARYLGREAIDEVMALPASDDPRDLTSLSPVGRVAPIRAAILLGHGDQNPRYHEKHALAMESALRRAGKRFESVSYRGATDVFLDDRQQIDFHARVGAFFERHLGPADETDRAAAPAPTPTQSSARRGAPGT